MSHNPFPSTPDNTQPPADPSTSTPDIDKKRITLTDEEWESLRLDYPDTEFTEAPYNDDRAIVKWLIDLRHRRGLTQQQVAGAMRCSDSTVSRIESGKDVHLGLVETSNYLRALGMDCRLQVSDEAMPHDVQLRRTVLAATRLLTRLHYLLRIRGEDEESLPELNAFITGVLSPLFLEAADSGLLDRDGVVGDIRVELSAFASRLA